MDTSVREAIHQLDLSNNPVYKLFHLFPKSLIRVDSDTSFTLFGEIEGDKSYFGGKRKGNRGRGASGKIPVFDILKYWEKVRVEVARNITGETLLTIVIKKVKRGSLIYIDKFRGYNGLISYGFRHIRIDHGKRFVNGMVYINGSGGSCHLPKTIDEISRFNSTDFPITWKNWNSNTITNTMIFMMML